MLEREVEEHICYTHFAPTVEHNLFDTHPEFIRDDLVKTHIELEEKHEALKTAHEEKERQFILSSAVIPFLLGASGILYNEHMVLWSNISNSLLLIVLIVAFSIIMSVLGGLFAAACISMPLSWLVKKLGFGRKLREDMAQIKKESASIEAYAREFFSDKKNQFQLLSDLAHYQKLCDETLGEGFSESCAEFMSLKHNLMQTVSFRPDRYRGIWSQIKDFYQPNRALNRAQVPFRAQTLARRVFNQVCGEKNNNKLSEYL